MAKPPREVSAYDIPTLVQMARQQTDSAQKMIEEMVRDVLASDFESALETYNQLGIALNTCRRFSSMIREVSNGNRYDINEGARRSKGKSK